MGFFVDPEGEGMTSSKTDDVEIERRRVLDDVAHRWSAACTPLRPADVAALYTKDALFFGGLPDLYAGRLAVTAYFEEYRSTLHSMTLTLRGGHLIGQGEDAFLFQGFADFLFNLPDGRQTRATLRATLALVRMRDLWLIRLHHFSPPPKKPPIPL